MKKKEKKKTSPYSFYIQVLKISQIINLKKNPKQKLTKKKRVRAKQQKCLPYPEIQNRGEFRGLECPEDWKTGMLLTEQR